MSTHLVAGRPRLRTACLLLACLMVAGAATHFIDRAKRRRQDADREALRELMAGPLGAKLRRTLTPDKLRPVGSQAPEFTLADTAGHRVSLSSFLGKRPVVLVFGSFGCTLFCNDLGGLRGLRDTYRDRVEFLFVYVSEAPHKDATPLPKASTALPPAGDSIASRVARVRWYEDETGANLTWLIDENGAAEATYDAWPRRLVVVGADGRIALDAGRGLSPPWDLQAVERKLNQALAVSTRSLRRAGLTPAGPGS
jgi:peroxiredoxin